MPSNSEHQAGHDLFRKVEETLEQLRASASSPPASQESWLKKTFSPAALSAHQSEFNMALVDALGQLNSALLEAAAGQEARVEQLEKELSELRALPESLDAFRERSVRIESELRSVAANVRGLQERSAALETELAQAREEQSQKVDRVAREQSDKIERLAGEQNDKIQRLAGDQDNKLERVVSDQNDKLARVVSEQSDKFERVFSEQSDRIQRLAGEQQDLGRQLGERIQHLLDEQRVCIRQLSLQASEEAVLADRARRATELKLEELARRIPPSPA